jgi:hypothetical protein
MTSSPDLIHELRASRPTAPAALRARVRELSAQSPARSRWTPWRVPIRRGLLFAAPAAAALAVASAGVLGLARSDVSTEASRQDALEAEARGEAAPSPSTTTAPDSAIGPATDRAQRVSATLTVEVEDADAVSRAAQDALDLTRALGGYVVSASVATGEEGSASLTVRVPVAKVQEAIVGLSALGRIVQQQVSVEDLQESLDALERRQRSVRAQIALVAARLESESLDAETRARLESRLRNLQADLRALRRTIAGTKAEARMATIQLTVVTPGALGIVPAPSRLDRTLDEALDVLAWEGVIALAIAIVAAPFALVALVAWLGRRLYRRREEERLLTAS